MKTYNSIQGDTWDLISKKVLGSEYAMTVLMQTNLDKIDTRIFEGGEVLQIPEIDSKPLIRIDPPWGK